MSKLVLILNCGSSSLKFAVMDAETGEDMLSGLAECFNLDDARIKWKLHGVKGEAMLGAGAAHQEALDHIVGHILPQDPTLAEQLVAIGHRIVHGGEQFSRSVRIDDGVIAGIEAAIPFAPAQPGAPDRHPCRAEGVPGAGREERGRVRHRLPPDPA